MWGVWSVVSTLFKNGHFDFSTAPCCLLCSYSIEGICTLYLWPLWMVLFLFSRLASGVLSLKIRLAPLNRSPCFSEKSGMVNRAEGLEHVAVMEILLSWARCLLNLICADWHSLAAPDFQNRLHTRAEQRVASEIHPDASGGKNFGNGRSHSHDLTNYQAW